MLTPSWWNERRDQLLSHVEQLTKGGVPYLAQIILRIVVVPHNMSVKRLTSVIITFGFGNRTCHTKFTPGLSFQFRLMTWCSFRSETQPWYSHPPTPPPTIFRIFFCLTKMMGCILLWRSSSHFDWIEKGIQVKVHTYWNVKYLISKCSMSQL